MTFWQVFRGLGWPFLFSYGPQKMMIGFDKFFLFLVDMTIYGYWKAELEMVYFFGILFVIKTVWSEATTYEEPSTCIILKHEVHSFSEQCLHDLQFMKTRYFQDIFPS